MILQQVQDERIGAGQDDPSTLFRMNGFWGGRPSHFPFYFSLCYNAPALHWLISEKGVGGPAVPFGRRPALSYAEQSPRAG